jgi:hypothetical protein
VSQPAPNPFARIQLPRQTYDALACGDITRLQFDLLLLLYLWADFTTGRVDSVSATRLHNALRDILHYENLPSEHSIRRHMRGLLQGKWFTRDYYPRPDGDGRTYHIWLTNYVIATYFPEQYSGNPADQRTHDTRKKPKEGSWERSAVNGSVNGCCERVEIVINRTEIIPWHKTEASRERVRGTAGVDTTNQEIPSPAAQDKAITMTAGQNLWHAGLAQRGAALAKSLPKIQARILRTASRPRYWREKYELMAIAHGQEAVEIDFEKWCREVQAQGLHPSQPIIEYAKVIDSRLGNAPPPEPELNLKDPRITLITALSFELTKFLPARHSVAKLLVDFTPEEITGATREYVGFSNRDKEGMKARMWKFFSEGAASAVIYSRRKSGRAASAAFYGRSTNVAGKT